MERRTALPSALVGAVILLFAGSLFVWGKQDVSPQASTATSAATLTHGPLVGDVRPDHVQVWLRTGASASVAVSYGTPGGARTTTPPVLTEAASDYTASVMVGGLGPGMAYEYQVLVDGVASSLHHFRTAPPDGDPGEFAIAVLSDSFGTSTAPIYGSVAALSPAGIFIIGDHDHYNPASNKNTADLALASMRLMHRRLRDSSTLLGADWVSKFLPADIPLLLRQEDDHDTLYNDSNRNSPYWPQVLRAWREYHPMLADNGLAAGGMWQRFRRGQVAFVSMDLRSNRNPASGSARTILGGAQKSWLSSALFELAGDPTVTWVVLVSTVPFNPAQPKGDSWTGYTADRAWLVNLVQATGLQNVLILSGDCHWGSIDDGTHSIFPELNVPKTNDGFANTCSNQPAQWTLNQKQAYSGFGVMTFRPDSAKLAIYSVAGVPQLTLTVPAKNSSPVCTRGNPSVSLSPAQGPTVSAGTAVSYTVSVTNHDTSACGASDFALQATVPDGWTPALGDASRTVNPGETGTTTLEVTSAVSAGPGTYPVSVKATNSQAAGYFASGSAQYVVAGAVSAFADNFDRADSTTLDNGWLEVKGDLRITSNELHVGAAGEHAALQPAFNASDQTAAADFAAADTTGSLRFGIVLRYQDPQNYYLLYRQTGGASRFYVSRVVNGVEQVLKYVSVTNPSRNTFFRLEGRATGTTLKLLFNGAERLSISDTTFAAGSAGISMTSNNATACRADNFSASAP